MRDSERQRTYDAETSARVAAVAYDFENRILLDKDEIATLVNDALAHFDDLGFAAETLVQVKYPVPNLVFARHAYGVSASSWRSLNKIRFNGSPSYATVLHEVAHLRGMSGYPGHGIMFRALLIMLYEEFTSQETADCLRLSFDFANLLYTFDERRAKKVRAHGVWLFNKTTKEYELDGYHPGSIHMRVLTTPTQDVNTGEIRSISISGKAIVDSKTGVTFKDRGLKLTGESAPLHFTWDQIAYINN